jgi:preprotein translocase subunit SecE
LSNKVETATSKLDGVKLGLAAIIAAGTLAAFYYYVDQLLLVRTVGLVAGLAIAAVIALQTDVGRNGRDFVLEARTEVRKVVWPTRKETVQTTVAVIVTVVLVAVLLWLLDGLLLWMVRAFTGRGG